MLKLSIKTTDFKNKNILLLTHENADLDSFTSAAIFNRILKKKKIKSRIAVPSHINEQALKFAFREKISFLVNPNLEEYDLIVIFDFNDFEQLGTLRKKFTKLQKSKCFDVIAIDHHEKEKRCISKKGIILPKYFSTTQILLNNFKRYFDKKSFFYSAIGIIEDTGKFIVADEKLFSDFSECLRKSGKKYSDITEVSKHEIDEGEKIAFFRAVRRARTRKINHIEVIISELNFYQGTASTKLLEFGAEIAIVIGEDKNGLAKLSSRAESYFKDKYNFNLMKDLLIPLQKVAGGEVGGHSGAAQWKGKTKKNTIIKEINKILEKKLLKLKVKN